MDHKYTAKCLVSEFMLHGRFNSKRATHEQTYIPVDHNYTAKRLVSEFMLHRRFNSMRAATHNSVDHKLVVKIW